MTLDLHYRGVAIADGLPVEVEGFTPDHFVGESLDAVKRHEAWVGNTRVAVGELFDITGDPAGGRWRMYGDLSGVHYLGAGMAAGHLHIDAHVGRHTAAGMRGGRVSISGAAGDWLGAEMRGGVVEVSGDAGDHVGSAYPGSPRGMRGGTIVVRGAAGDYTGHTMRRGMIAIGGDCGQLAGYRMRAGTLLVHGRCGPRPGAEMARGTIGLFGSDRPELLPTFRFACRHSPAVLTLIQRHLPSGFAELPTAVEQWNGDLLCGGRGEVLIASHA